MREVYIFDRKELETWIENKEKATRDEIKENNKINEDYFNNKVKF